MAVMVMVCGQRRLLLWTLVMFGVVTGQQQDFNEVPVVTSYDPYFQRANNPNQIFFHSFTEAPRYLVVAPAVVRPSTVYKVVVSLLRELQETSIVDIRTYLSRDGVEMASAIKSMTAGHTETLLLKVPPTSIPGQYRLRIEGNHPGLVGGTVFLNETDLSFSGRFLTIVVQTNRHVYNGDQMVRFRAVILTTEMKPFDDPVTVYILDPRGFVMRRWPSVETTYGVVSLQYKLPELAKVGHWRIRIEARSQIEDTFMKVETYYQPQFEVFIAMPTFYLDSADNVDATVSALYGTEKTVRGNVTVRLYAKQMEPYEEYELLWIHYITMMEGSVDVSYPMWKVRSTIGRLDRVQLRMEADVKEFFLEETRMGFTESRIINSSLHLRFLGSSPAVFKPGMPFENYVAVSYHDQEPIAKETLENSNIRVEIYATVDSGGAVQIPEIFVPSKRDSYGFHQPFETWNEFDVHRGWEKYLQDQVHMKYRSEGILRVKFDVPPRASQLILRAYYFDDEGNRAQTEMTAYAYYSPRRKYLGVTTSTKNAQIGEYVIFHVKINYPVESFHYLIVSKDILLYADEQVVDDTWQTITTFSLPVSPEMAPSFRIVVYHVTREGEVISDSLFIPVNGINRHKMNLSLNQAKDKSKDSVEFKCEADAGAFYATSVQRLVRHTMQAGNEISKASVMEALHTFENYSRSVHKVIWRSRDGSLPDRSEYFESMNYGIDSNRTFTFAGLIVLTDAVVPLVPHTDYCNVSRGLYPCLTQGCYIIEKKCDGFPDCVDGYDEAECPPPHDDIIEFRENRINRFADFYDIPDGDWAWMDVHIGHSAVEWYNIPVPRITDSWWVNGFSISKDRGFGIIEAPIQYDSFRQFMMVVDVPPAIRRGETLGIRTILFNRLDNEVLVVLTLHGSDDYKFVRAGYDGSTNSYNPTLSGGDQQHLVWIRGQSEEEVRIPIAPQVDLGTIDVTVSASTQVAHDVNTFQVEILPEGATVAKHTSVFLDLKNRATVLRFMDIFVEETPIIPYNYWRRYIYGSPIASVTLCGDVLGPVFPTTPVTMDTLLGRSGRGTESRVFDLAGNLWMLHYLRLTNQLKWSKAREVFNYMNSIFANIMKRYSSRGWFKMWNISKPSVWLTAWVIHTFKHATFQDWENYFYIEPQIFSRSIRWLLNYQTENGTFTETPWYSVYPLNKKMDQRSPRPHYDDPNYREHDRFHRPHDHIKYRNISLTAQVLITVHETIEMLDGNLRSEAITARLLATRYLEQQLPQLTDAYEIAITTYALWLCDSTEKETAFQLLNSVKREEEGLIYWSPGQVPFSGFKLENQRPFLLPKDNQYWDSVAVEATAYALLVYLMRDGVTIPAEKMVYWMNSVRLNDGAFISTLDTVIAWQALTEYAFRARLRDITDMRVTVESSSTANFSETLLIGNTSLATPQSMEIPNVWGHINVVARGAGQALIQMHVTFGVDYDEMKDTPPKDCFELKIKETYHQIRNRSAVTIQSCMRWTLFEESEVSGAAVLEIEIPTGYGLLQTDAIRLVAEGVHPTLMDAKTMPGKTMWFFEYIPGNWTCFNHTVKRWHPVANLTQYKGAYLYEAYAPERFVMEVTRAVPLNALGICEVCASYQCPYCPYYSVATSIVASFGTILASLIALHFRWTS